MIGEDIKVRGRIFVPIDTSDVDEGDVVRFFHNGWRTAFASGRRGGKAAAVRVVDPYGAVRWVCMRMIKGAWRRRTRLGDQ